MIPPKVCVLLASLLVITSSFANSTRKEWNSEKSRDTLKLVHLVFRHGDRTNDVSTFYPRDPYLNETYYPYGIGQLTNKGKQREYSLGKKLRQRYNEFLGDIYTPNVLEAVSTEINRAKMSLELVLAGLFPPKGTILEWEKGLNWQPIGYKHLMFANDHLLAPAFLFCDNYRKLLQSYMRSTEGQSIEGKYTELFEFMSLNTGLNITSTLDVFRIYFALTVEEEWGFKLPLWTHAVYPQFMENATIDFYIESIADAPLKQLSGGFLLKKIIDDTLLKLSGKLTSSERKMYLYSGHEFNIVYILGALGVYFPHIPPYGACVIIEVHRVDNIDGIQVFYENYSGNEPIPLNIPGCEIFCPFNKFISLLKQHIPNDDNMCNN